jgi:type II secretory pathway pseudopilin PulG
MRADMKKGFTLIDVLITICIMAVMSGIAIPTFNAARQKNEASQAMSYNRAIRMALLQHYSKWGNLGGVGALTNAAQIRANLGVEIASTNYTFSVNVTAAGNSFAAAPTRPTFLITASGPQGTLELNEAGTWTGTYTPLPNA